MSRASKSKGYLNNPNLPTPGAEYEWTPEMVQNIKRCRDDIIYFAENFFYIINYNATPPRQTIKLHDYQKEALKRMLDNRFTGYLFARQSGKALDVNTPINTPTGWKTMGELKTGDQVFGSDGKPCNVTHAHDVLYNRNCYKITFDNGEEIVADEDHLWFTQTRKDRYKKIDGATRTTKEIYNTLFVGSKKEPNHRIKSVMLGVDYTTKALPINPYILGVWLGDGASTHAGITSGIRDKDELIENIYNRIQFDKITVKEYTKDVFIILPSTAHLPRSNSLNTILRKNNLINNKHIPEIYLRSDREQRLELLRGLIDSDGYITPHGAAQFSNSNILLVKQVKELIESLGYKTTYKEYIPSYDGMPCKLCAVVTFYPREPVCTFSFKLSRIKISNNTHIHSAKRNQWHYIKSIEKVETRPVRCISVDGPGNLYLVGKTNIPTHNSTVATIFLMWFAIFNDDQSILLIANKESTAKEIFKRIKLAYENIPNYMKPGTEVYGKEGLKLENGSEIKISTTTGTAARGSSCSILYIDEMDFIEAHLVNEFWASVYPIISASKTSRIVITSTPNNTSGLFYKLYSGSLKEENGWKFMKITWRDVPGRDEEWMKTTMASMESPALFSREFNCEFDQAGESAVDNFEELRSKVLEPQHILDEGHYKLWKTPTEGRCYVAGVDVSEGIGQDASVIQILDITNIRNIEQVGIYHNNRISPAEFTPKLLEILEHWGSPLVMVERNNHGAQVVDNLRNIHKYENIVSYGAAIANRNRGQLGIISHTNTKYRAVQNERYWRIVNRCVQINDIDTVMEYNDFARAPNGTWGARHNCKDDRVMSFIWALMILDNDLVEQYFEILERDDAGRPSGIKLLDFGIKHYINPSSIYSDVREGYGEASPALIGNQIGAQREIDDLIADGWEFPDDVINKNDGSFFI